VVPTKGKTEQSENIIISGAYQIVKSNKKVWHFKQNIMNRMNRMNSNCSISNPHSHQKLNTIFCFPNCKEFQFQWINDLTEVGLIKEREALPDLSKTRHLTFATLYNLLDKSLSYYNNLSV
jgi:hypothetical protein